MSQDSYLAHTNKDNKNELLGVFDNAIKVFAKEGKKVEGVYDLLIRGGGAIDNHLFVENWSDLDLSIIVEKIDSSILKQARQVYGIIKNQFPYKLSITLVTKKDFLNNRHYHGIKPIYYAENLSTSISLLNSPLSRKKNMRLRDLKIDCLSNIAYLIHDLRSRSLHLLENDEEKLFEFFCHLVKRTKHFIRNALFIMTGCVDEEINFGLFKKCFPDIEEEFPKKLKKYKETLIHSSYSFNDLKDNVDRTFDVLEAIHEKLIDFVALNLT